MTTITAAVTTTITTTTNVTFSISSTVLLSWSYPTLGQFPQRKINPLNCGTDFMAYLFPNKQHQMIRVLNEFMTMQSVKETQAKLTTYN